MASSSSRTSFKLNYLFLLTFLISVTELSNGLFQFEKSGENEGRFCFCQLQGTIDDCSCNVDTVDHYNNVRIFPRLQSLLVRDYFRFYKVKLDNECPFWPDDYHCAIKFCHVQQCEEKDLPPGLKGEKPSTFYRYSKEAQTVDTNSCNEDIDVELGHLDTSISDTKQMTLEKWTEHDEQLDNFCLITDNQEGAQYVDLLLNPERYTGYKGDSAQKIWRSIYLENCFKFHSTSPQSSYNVFIPYRDVMSGNGVCLEQRAFYRMVSGFHASINIHLSARFLLSEKTPGMGFAAPTGVWGTSYEEFEKRFSPATTHNEGPHWLRNLYFAYLVEMRALAKAAPYLRQEKFFTGVEEEDKEVRMAVNDLLNVIEAFPAHFNESAMFNGGASSLKLKTEFREKFMNITRIMDCVGCDKCRLWGKLQTQGMGTALKILFSGKFDDKITDVQVPLEGEKPEFKLQRSEIVSLFNAYGRLSTSIHLIEQFREHLQNR